MRLLILGRSVGLKKKKKNIKKKKNHKKSLNSSPWYPRTTLKVNIHIFGLKKCSIYCEKYMFMFLFLFFSMLLLYMLIFQIKRVISSEKWCNYVVTFFSI